MKNEPFSFYSYVGFNVCIIIFNTCNYIICIYVNNVKCFNGNCLGSMVRPKVVRSVHYCPATKKIMERRYTDLTSFDPFPSSAAYPNKVSSLYSTCIR